MYVMVVLNAVLDLSLVGSKSPQSLHWHEQVLADYKANSSI